MTGVGVPFYRGRGSAGEAVTAGDQQLNGL
jgi:hypothetical protein